MPDLVPQAEDLLLVGLLGIEVDEVPFFVLEGHGCGEVVTEKSSMTFVLAYFSDLRISARPSGDILWGKITMLVSGRGWDLYQSLVGVPGRLDGDHVLESGVTMEVLKYWSWLVVSRRLENRVLAELGRRLGGERVVIEFNG